MVDLVPQTTHGTNKGKIELYERIIFCFISLDEIYFYEVYFINWGK